MSGIANTDNLKKGNPATQFKAGREQVENARKAGIKSGESKRKKKGIREAMQALLDTEYHLKDKATGEIKTMTGEEAIALGILNTAMNPKDKNWKAAVQYALQLNGDDKSKTEQKLIKAQAKMLKAKADLLTGADTTTLDKLDSILNGMKELAEADAPIGDSNDKAESETE
ncbi:MAG: hypothetical protein J6A30_09605 [Ruminococcus sp.]|nr:hypothetical protein [Ruminococcus sp.]